MSFYNYNDIQLHEKVNEIKESMQEALELINACDNDSTSEFYTSFLKKSIERFLEDY